MTVFKAHSLVSPISYLHINIHTKQFPKGNDYAKFIKDLRQISLNGDRHKFPEIVSDFFFCSVANVCGRSAGPQDRAFVRASALLHSHFSQLDTLQEAIVRLESVFECQSVHFHQCVLTMFHTHFLID